MSGVYSKLAMLNHSCSPNCILKSGKHESLILIATQDIHSKEELTIGYRLILLPEDDKPSGLVSLEIATRRKWILDVFGFVCQCSYCKAGFVKPRENGKLDLTKFVFQ